MRRPAKNFHCHRTLFERPVFTRKGLYTDILKKLLAALTAMEHRAGQDLLQLAADLVRVRRRIASHAQRMTICYGFRHGTLRTLESSFL